jgi:hypothetical protein
MTAINGTNEQKLNYVHSAMASRPVTSRARAGLGRLGLVVAGGG